MPPGGLPKVLVKCFYSFFSVSNRLMEKLWLILIVNLLLCRFLYSCKRSLDSKGPRFKKFNYPFGGRRIQRLPSSFRTGFSTKTEST